jgi:gas vesicle protein
MFVVLIEDFVKNGNNVVPNKGGGFMSDRTDFIKGMLVGGFIGAVVGILYAPKSGKETREEIGKKAEELMAKAKEEYEAALEKSKKAYEAALANLKQAESAAKERIEQIEEKVEDLAERGKDTLQDTKCRLKKAVEAGVEAFKEEKGKIS